MKSRFAFLALLAAGICAPTLAGAQEYAFDLPGKHPAAFAAWKKIVPARYRKIDWIGGLDGTATPIDPATLQGRPFYLGELCKPHDCGGNEVAFLIAIDGSAAYGMLKSETLGVKQQLFGAPDAEALKLLESKFSN
jgi:Inhibitor of vertebrate lysozyme (Ivy)